MRSVEFFNLYAALLPCFYHRDIYSDFFIRHDVGVVF